MKSALTVARRTAFGWVRRSVGDGTRRPSLATRGLVPILHLTSAAARKLAAAESPVTSPTQKLALQALGAQLRAAASSLLPSDASRDPDTFEGALAQAVSDTLRLLDRALQEDPALHGSPAASRNAEPLPFTVSEEAPEALPAIEAARDDGLTPSE